MSDDVSIPNPGYTGRRAGRYGRAARVGLSPDSKRLMLYAGGLGGVLVVMVTASTLTGRHSGPVPVVEPDPRPLRVKPENPGGLKVDAAESDVFSGPQSTTNAQLAPPPEVPNPSGLQAPPKPKPAPVAQTALPAPGKPVSAAREAVTPAKPGTASAGAVATPPQNSPTQAATTAREAPAATKPTVVASATPAVNPAAASAKPAAHAPAVQLAALSSEAAAKEEWQKLQRQMPDMFGGKQPTIIKAERDGRSFWRLRTSGFADLAQARGFCEKVRAKGGACSVADF